MFSITCKQLVQPPTIIFALELQKEKQEKFAFVPTPPHWQLF